MKSLKIFLIFFLPFGPVLAQKALIDTIPDFYFVEEALESAGATLTVHACQGEDLHPDNLTEAPASDCTPVEVALADLDQFLKELNTVLESPEEAKKYGWYQTKKILAPLAGAGAMVGTVVGTMSSIMYFAMGVRHPSFLGPTSALMTAFISASTLFISLNTIKNLSEGNPYATNQRLVQQISAGLVYDEDRNHTDQHFAMKRFTEFLNARGRRPQTE